jgi:hypothetical protein
MTDIDDRVASARQGTSDVMSSLLLQNRSLCRMPAIHGDSQLQHLEYHRANAEMLGNVLLAASYDALIEASGLST